MVFLMRDWKKKVFKTQQKKAEKYFYLIFWFTRLMFTWLSVLDDDDAVVCAI